MRQTAHNQSEAGRQLNLPMTATFAVKVTANRAVAHALDFDLVAVATTQERALQKLRAAVKHHIEFGFRRELSNDTIQKKAPQECWERLYNRPWALGEDIEIDHQQSILTRVLINEPDRDFAAA